MTATNCTTLQAFVCLVLLQSIIGIMHKSSLSSTSGTYIVPEAGNLATGELTKLFISLTFLQLSASKVYSYFKLVQDTDKSIIPAVLESPRGDIMGIASLALGYTVSNHLKLYLFTISDHPAIALINTGSSVMSAIVLWQFADRHPKRLQWVAIITQTTGLVISQV
jgi:hypothetical protein